MFAEVLHSILIDVQSWSITTEFYKIVECDFTTSDNWFIYYGGHSWTSNWRNSNWLYWYTSDASYKACAWKIPSTIYSLWRPLKIELELSWSKAWCWWWISYGLDTWFSRIWLQQIQYRWLNTTVVEENIPNQTPANQVYKFTIDFESKTQYSSLFPNITKALPDAEITQIYNYWNWWNLNICAMLNNSWNLYSYIKKATFKIKAP